MRLIVLGADVWAESVLPFAFLDIDGGRIRSFGSAKGYKPLKGATYVEGDNLNLSPGWVDLQVNGIGNRLFEDAQTEADIKAIGDALLERGTTRWFGALVSCPAAKLDGLLALVQSCIGKHGLSGVHVEGPWLNPDYRGCHPNKRLRKSSPKHLAFVEALPCPTIVTVAPEIIANEDLETLTKLKQVKLFMGHCDGNDRLHRASDFAGVTHIMNGMRAISARQPGALGWLIADSKRVASIIGDGLHVDAGTVALLKRAAGRGQVFLVSDAMPASASTAATVDFLKDVRPDASGALRNSEGKLAGSNSSIRDGLRFLVQRVGIPMEEALRMATCYPARAAGLEPAVFAPGRSGDFVLFDNQFNVREARRFA